jgi:hypothetical protein
VSNDFFATYLELPQMGWKFLARSELPGKGYTGLLWLEDQDGRECTILHDAFEASGRIARIEHYYRANQFNYTSPVWFLVAQLIHRHSLSILRNRIFQGAYNHRTLIRADRIALLQYLVEQSLQTPGKHFDVISLGVQMHTIRWIFHPKREEHQAYLRLVLESLCVTGDIDRVDGSFQVNPKALATLSAYENEERKHRDDINTSRVGHRISLAIFVVGVLAIAAQLFMWWRDHSG